MDGNLITHDFVAYSPGAEASFFIRPNAESFSRNSTGTPIVVRKLVNTLNIVPWGEDNRFPQNITQLMSACSIGLAGLEWKMRALYGAGIIPVRITGYEDEGKKEVVQPLQRTGADKVIWDYLESQQFRRFYLEFLQDWVWFGNCFPEGILSKDGKKITGWVHQESCDARYEQMDDKGKINHIYLSKMWSLSRQQYKTFDPEKIIPGLMANPARFDSVDKKFIAKIHAIDMYDPVASLREHTNGLPASNKFKSFILPVNWPSPNQPYYQVPAWDGARVAGWIDIASKIPVIISTLMNKTFAIKYHIEIPEEYFQKRVGAKWGSMSTEQRRAYRSGVIAEMETFLKGPDKAGSAFISYFDTDQNASGANKEYNRIKITEFKSAITIDKELLGSAGVNTEILASMNLNPDVLGVSVPGGAYGGNKGGSNIREGKLVYDSMLGLERQTTLEPLYLMRDYNGWDSDIRFRHRDTVLTTLDKGKGTEKTLS